jgi:hypothetical protein
MTYQAILFAPDGDYVTDFAGSESIEEVTDKLADMGSRWYFYPFAFVIRDKRIVSLSVSFMGTDVLMRQRIVNAAPELGILKGKSVQTVHGFFEEHGEQICANLDANFPVLDGIEP